MHRRIGNHSIGAHRTKGGARYQRSMLSSRQQHPSTCPRSLISPHACLTLRRARPLRTCPELGRR
eukprot:2387141-Rhodomonas_salina.1